MIQLELPGIARENSLSTALNWMLETVDCSAATRQMHADHARYLMRSFGNERRVAEITGSDVCDYMRREVVRGLSKETVRKRISTLKLALREAVFHGVIPAVPLLPVIRCPKRPRRGYWTMEQMEAVRSVCDDEDLRAWFAVNWWTGMHMGDIDRFRWQDVNFSNSTWVRRNTKVMATPVPLPLPSRFKNILRERYEAHQPHPRDLVCGHKIGSPYQQMRVLAERADVPLITPLEAGRHSTATYLDSLGTSELFQMTWLGLKTPRPLKGHYTHVTPDVIAANMTKLDESR